MSKASREQLTALGTLNYLNLITSGHPLSACLTRNGGCRLTYMSKFLVLVVNTFISWFLTPGKTLFIIELHQLIP